MKENFLVWLRLNWELNSTVNTGLFNSQAKRVLRQNSWRRQWHPTPVLLPGKSHGRRSLVGCGPWGREESDTTERLPFHFSLSCIGEGNGNTLQCSCQENHRDRGAWWAAVYGVAQSRTWLKWLSSICLPVQETIDVGLIPGSGRSPGGEHGYPFQYSCL